MTLSTDGGVWWVACDFCSDSHDVCEEGIPLVQVVEQLTEAGWESHKDPMGGDWEHSCPSCAEERIKT